MLFWMQCQINASLFLFLLNRYVPLVVSIMQIIPTSAIPTFQVSTEYRVLLFHEQCSHFRQRYAHSDQHINRSTESSEQLQLQAVLYRIMYSPAFTVFVLGLYVHSVAISACTPNRLSIHSVLGTQVICLVPRALQVDRINGNLCTCSSALIH